MNIKVYVDVTARFNSEGVLIPLSLTWEDGEEFEIDRVTDIRQAAAMKAGGQGDRYTIWVRGNKAISSLNGTTLSPGTTWGVGS